MRWRNIAVALLITLTASAAALLGATGDAKPAYACSCVTVNEREHYRDADAVFTGVLVDRREPFWWPVTSSGGRVTLTFQVDQVYKGEVRELQQVTTALSGASCGLELSGEGPFVVFAHRDSGDGAALAAALCGGTRPVAAGAVPEFGTGEPPLPGGSVPSRLVSGGFVWLAVLGLVLAAVWLLRRRLSGGRRDPGAVGDEP